MMDKYYGRWKKENGIVKVIGQRMKWIKWVD